MVNSKVPGTRTHPPHTESFNTQHRHVSSLHKLRSSQCSTTGVTKTVVGVILSVGWCI